MDIFISDPVYGAYLATLALSVFISVGLISYLWQRRYITAVAPVIGILVCIIFWSGGYLLEQTSNTLSNKLFMYNIEYIGIATIPVFLLLFALQYTRQGHLITIRRLILLSIIPLITIFLVWTKGFHTLMYQRFSLQTFGSVSYVTNEYGPWFWIFLTFVYLLIIASTIILIRGLLRRPHKNYRQTASIIIIVLFPIAANVLYVFRLLPSMPYVDWTGSAFAISSILMTYAIVRQRFLDVLPIARDTAIERMSDGYLVLDSENYILDLNNKMQSILGLSPGKAIGYPLPETLINQLNLKENNNDRVEIELNVEGENRYFRVNFSPLKQNEGSVLLFYDITESKQFEHKLSDMATHDFLTGLPNRVILQDRLEMAVARAKRNNSKFAIMVCDLDNFKGVNDTLGHGIADKLLQAIGARLNSKMRGEDTLARAGGDEFVVLLSRISTEEEVTAAARRILEAFQEKYIIEGHEITISISIGIAIYPDSGTGIGTLLKNADDAMYVVKKQGRGNFHICNQ